LSRDAAAELQKVLEDLTGQRIPLPRTIPKAAVTVLAGGKSRGLGYSQFNELLLYLGYDRVSHAFFQYLVDRTTEYKSRASISTLSQFRAGVDEFRKVALLFFGNVKYAFKNLSRDASFLRDHLTRFDPRREQNFKDRHDQVLPPEMIDGEDTYYLGYVIQEDLRARLRATPKDKALLAEEAKRVEIVERGKRNQDAYLVSDHLDVYIATSMRERHEYLMVYNTTRAIFSHRSLKNLKVRYFDPTQAYCIDRIDKGLAEGLMLKRAKCTIYFAQESDTFGKDSELASTLAQGKPVIAYVPSPASDAAQTLLNEVVPAGRDFAQPLLRLLRLYEPESAWADVQVRNWVEKPTGIDRGKGIARLQVAMEKQFKKRNSLLREVHPLGIQVNLKTGVANGVLVVNTIEQCAKLVRALLLRELQFFLKAETKNGSEYLFLKETISDSIFRVVSGDTMLTNAFWNFYLNPSE
jgi:hypothetical protein